MTARGMNGKGAEFVHLHVHSPFSFLDGASSLEALVDRAVALGMPALALTDHNNLSGAVKFVGLARQKGIKPIVGVEVEMVGGYHLVLLAQNPEGYSNLCRLLTKAHLNHQRNSPQIDWDGLAQYSAGIVCLSGCRRGLIPSKLLQGHKNQALEAAQKFLQIFGKKNFYLELQSGLYPGDQSLNHWLVHLAEHLGVETVATGNVHYAQREEFGVHDLLTCVRTLTKLADIHPERPLNGENYLKTPVEMGTLFGWHSRAIANTLAIAQSCQNPLELDGAWFPEFASPQGQRSDQYLRSLVNEGAYCRYGTITSKISQRLEHELEIIIKLGFEDYFLMVWDLVQWAKSHRIRYAGRGSAADSAVAYCLGITEVDSIARGLLFERFMSLERAQKPDIDIDFDSRYRDRVSQYVYAKYGVDFVATVGTYNTFHARSAIRDLGKAMGFDAEELGVLAKKFPHIHADGISTALEKFPELRASGLPMERYQGLFTMCEAVAGFPRFLGTHVGGLVVSRVPLNQLTPLQQAAKGIVVTQFDKDDIEDLGLIKLDLLSLRTMAAIEDSVVHIRKQGKAFDYDTLPLDDPATYQMLNTGHTIGTFQLESPAQRALQARLQASELEDIVASVALIRPGPIKGNMVEPFINRRNGMEPITYLHPKLRPILEKTYGVILFQEQVLEIAIVVAGFTPGEADKLRKVMTHARSVREMERIGQMFVQKVVGNGVAPKVAEDVFACMAGYASYGFCEAHAVAFATTAYKTAYLVEHYPAEFFAALLSHQPLGYYPPGTLLVEARRRGVQVLAPDVLYSEDNFTVEDGKIRVGLGMIKDMTAPAVEKIRSERQHSEFTSLRDLYLRTGLDSNIVENLILAGALDSLHDNRRWMLWQLAQLKRERELNTTKQLVIQEEAVDYQVEDFSLASRLAKEYQVLGFNAIDHLMAFWRRNSRLPKGMITSKDLANAPEGQLVTVAGLVVRPHRPPTKSGKTVVFLALEDEFGLSDVTIFNNVYQKCGQLIFGGGHPPLVIRGRVQHRGRGVSVTASEVRLLVVR